MFHVYLLSITCFHSRWRLKKIIISRWKGRIQLVKVLWRRGFPSLRCPRCVFHCSEQLCDSAPCSRVSVLSHPRHSSFLLEKSHDWGLLGSFACAGAGLLLTLLLVRSAACRWFCREGMSGSLFGGLSCRVVFCFRVRLALVAFLRHCGKQNGSPEELGTPWASMFNYIKLITFN